MKLTPLTREQCQQVREWRNDERQFLRTPYFITEDMQEEFFHNVVNNRDSEHRYFAIMNYSSFIGMGGLTNISFENGNTEISLIINPEYRGKGYGIKSVDLLLHEAINNMRLYSVYGEVYDCGNRGFWEKVVYRYSGYRTDLVNRKFWEGHTYGSMWFSIGGLR
jgi:RimJ/RimL family protein N-acetyltransferase